MESNGKKRQPESGRDAVRRERRKGAVKTAGEGFLNGIRDMNLPNKLTCLRMILIIPFVLFMLVGKCEGVSRWFALFLFCAASITDTLDGYIRLGDPAQTVYLPLGTTQAEDVTFVYRADEQDAGQDPARRIEHGHLNHEERQGRIGDFLVDRHRDIVIEIVDIHDQDEKHHKPVYCGGNCCRQQRIAKAPHRDPAPLCFTSLP